MDINKKIIILFLSAIGFTLPACDNDKHEDIPDGRVPITLSSSAFGDGGGMKLRAVPEFPNDQAIGVVSAFYNEGPPFDWTSYSDINNARATVSSVTPDSIYYFAWDETKYWPFDDRPIVFMAYSPYPNGESVILDATNSILLLDLHEDMPDVLYAGINDTANMVPYYKSLASPPGPPVVLGIFNHVMSKLTIELYADDNMPENIVVSSLKVGTSRKTAEYHLERGSEGLIVNDIDESFIKNIVSENTAFKNQPIVDSLYLFPGTEDVTEVTIELLDLNAPTAPFSRTYMMSFFQNASGNGEPLTLQRGMNTTLRITVQGIPITSNDVILQGVISPWNQKGNFGINIY